MLPENGYSAWCLADVMSEAECIQRITAEDRCLDEGEMDIMEMVSGDGKEGRSEGLRVSMETHVSRSQAYHAYHWMSSWPANHCSDFETFHRSVSSNTIVRGYNSDFHEYAVERQEHGEASPVAFSYVLCWKDSRWDQVRCRRHGNRNSPCTSFS